MHLCIYIIINTHNLFELSLTMTILFSINNVQNPWWKRGWHSSSRWLVSCKELMSPKGPWRETPPTWPVRWSCRPPWCATGDGLVKPFKPRNSSRKGWLIDTWRWFLGIFVNFPGILIAAILLQQGGKDYLFFTLSIYVYIYCPVLLESIKGVSLSHELSNMNLFMFYSYIIFLMKI